MHTSSWRAAKQWSLQRFNPQTKKMEGLEPGTNFFVLALEMLGARSLFSCEGHPHGFYVAFTAPYSLAHAINEAGYFDVSIQCGDMNQWAIRLSSSECCTKAWNEEVRDTILCSAAQAWLRAFPRLEILCAQPLAA